MAGGYNRLRSEIQGRNIDTDELVNLTNWTRITFASKGSDWFSWNGQFEVLKHQKLLNIKEGVLMRRVSIKQPNGCITTILRYPKYTQKC